MKNVKEILQFIKFNPNVNRLEIESGLNISYSSATLKRILSGLIKDGDILVTGKGKAIRYNISPQASVTTPLNIDTYFLEETDKRKIQAEYNFGLINNVLPIIEIFTSEEQKYLNTLQLQFLNNLKNITHSEYRKEMEHLGIDLSWKSSQIEGNTYTLLETEILLKERQTASGKSKEEAIMLLNHKDALDFILEDPSYFTDVSIRKIEELHAILVKDLDIDKGIRKRRIGITGTNYRPLDNEFQIREALTEACNLVNSKSNIFEKALLILMLLSYIQAFTDGNKRTARIVSNAILIANNYCPLSFRSVEALDYKKAMLIFYEQNNISAFKKIFIEQFAFAINTYF